MTANKVDRILETIRELSGLSETCNAYDVEKVFSENKISNFHDRCSILNKAMGEEETFYCKKII